MSLQDLRFDTSSESCAVCVRRSIGVLIIHDQCLDGLAVSLRDVFLDRIQSYKHKAAGALRTFNHAQPPPRSATEQPGRAGHTCMKHARLLLELAHSSRLLLRTARALEYLFQSSLCVATPALVRSYYTERGSLVALSSPRWRTIAVVVGGAQRRMEGDWRT